MSVEIAHEQAHGAKAHAAPRTSYVIPRGKRGRLFWLLLDVILWIGGAR